MERNFSFDKQLSSFKIDKAVKFLSLPDIENISADVEKAEFLKSKGLNNNEVSEAFHRHRTLQAVNLSEHAIHPQLVVHAVNNIQDDNRNGELVQQQNIKLGSMFFSFCQKLILFAGIASMFYVLYEKLLRSRIEKNKTDKTIREELNQIRNELAKISNELRQHQSLERSQATLMSEISSLKAILAGRQYFEEKQTAKLSLPFWQLNEKSAPKPRTPIPKVKSVAKTDKANSNKTNDVLISGEEGETSNQKNETWSATNDISVSICMLSEDDDPKISQHINGLHDADKGAPEITNENNSNSAIVSPAEKKEEKKRASKLNMLENGQKSKKIDKKN